MITISYVTINIIEIGKSFNLQFRGRCVKVDISIRYVQIFMKINRAYREIVNAFVRLLDQKNYEKISICEIVKESTFSRSSFYTYFATKEDLLRETVQMYSHQYAMLLNETLQSTFAIEENTLVFTEKVLEYVKENEDFFRLLIDNKFPSVTIDTFCDEVERSFRDQSEFLFCAKPLHFDENFFYFVSTRHFFTYILYWRQKNFEIPPKELAFKVNEYLFVSSQGRIIHTYCEEDLDV